MNQFHLKVNPFLYHCKSIYMKLYKNTSGQRSVHGALTIGASKKRVQPRLHSFLYQLFKILILQEAGLQEYLSHIYRI